MTDTMGPAARHFYDHAGWFYNPATETEEEGRRRGAERLAAAERWLAERPHSIEWTEDRDADRSFLPRRDRRPLFGCIVKAKDGGGGWRAESLWGIDLGPTGCESDDYMRVVVAELAAELMTLAVVDTD